MAGSRTQCGDEPASESRKNITALKTENKGAEERDCARRLSHKVN